VGSHSVNGVSDLHSRLLQTKLFKDFYGLYPERFNNKTNGITQRRWLLKANTRLSELITWVIGDKWTTELTELKKILPYKDKKSFREKWNDIKKENKKDLSEYLRRAMDVTIDPETLFDVQVKRIHEYKRQLLFALFIISQYLTIKNDPKAFKQPRTFMVGGKAAPGYYMAKLIIKFFNNIAEVINRDKAARDKIKVVFLENYRVSLAEKVFPASDLSEQISTAGKEASGTGNMKFMLNGALTIGTLDGANIEINQYLDGKDIFIFGHQEHEIARLVQQGYNPQDFVQKSPRLKEIFRMIKNNHFSPSEPGIFEPILESVFYKDTYCVCADFDAYCQMQDVVSEAYQNKAQWIKSSIRNVAQAGEFSSDRTIRQYARDIWKVPCR
jgi:starch phosphorylase